jgi:hypothetical protein
VESKNCPRLTRGSFPQSLSAGADQFPHPMGSQRGDTDEPKYNVKPTNMANKLTQMTIKTDGNGRTFN